MPAKLFRQRFANRELDAISVSASVKVALSFHLRANEVTPGIDPAFLNYAAGTGTLPSNTYSDELKAENRADSILFTDLHVPKSSRILGGWIQLVTAEVPGGTEAPFPGLDVALYPELTPVSDQHNWRGITPTKSSPIYEWRHVQLNSRDRVNALAHNASNFWFKIRSTLPPATGGQTASADAAVATTGLCAIGRNVADERSGNRLAFNNAYGNVLQIENSVATINNVLARVSRSGTFATAVNVVCRVYNYDAVNRKIGSLRATSSAVSAGGITTSATLETSFAFTAFAVTAGEYLFLAIEPQTSWPTGNTGALNGRFLATASNSTSGANPAGSEEIIWWQPRNTGNRIPYFSVFDPPLLYSGITGVTVEDRPYQNVIERLNFDRLPMAGDVNTVHRLFLTERMMRALEAYNYGHNDVGGVQIYLGTGDNNNYAVNWNPSVTVMNGLYVVYRSTRTFIT